MTRYLLWDFDGTLGYREGGAWTASLLEVLDRALPGHSVTLEQLRAYTRTGFPWQDWEQPHTHLKEGGAWWDALLPIFERAYTGVGLAPAQARDLARQFRATYLALDRWRRFDDVVPTLKALAAQGWHHAILSNHVPELGDIVQHLGLMPHIDRLFNSAELGYEKPHSRVFQLALAALPQTERVWMIGDSFSADVQGARGVGLPAILVRRHHPEATHFAETLHDVMKIINSEHVLGVDREA